MSARGDAIQKKFALLERIARDSRLPAGAVRVLIMFAVKYINGGSGIAWPSEQTLAKDIGVTERSISTYVRAAVGLGYLEKVRRGKRQTNTYRWVGDRKEFSDHHEGDRKEFSGVTGKNFPVQTGKNLPVTEGKSEQNQRPESENPQTESFESNPLRKEGMPTEEREPVARPKFTGIRTAFLEPEQPRRQPTAKDFEHVKRKSEQILRRLRATVAKEPPIR